MGYTHYWYRTAVLNAEKFEKAVEDCNLVCEELDTKIQYEWDEPKSPVFGAKQIRFNGVGEDDGYETFNILQKFKSPSWRKDEDAKKRLVFNFCKTANKPYDINVTCCLVVFKHHFGDDFEVRSDGESKDWQEARDKCEKILGYGADFKLDKDES